MKTKRKKENNRMKKLFVLLIMLIIEIGYGQSYNLSVQQDPSLLISGDGQTGKSSTANILARVSYDFDSYNYERVAYWSFFLSFEYADLRTIYQRYSTGFKYNYKISDKFIWATGYDFGLTYRGSDNTRAGNPQIKYITQGIFTGLEFKLTDNLHIIVNSQVVDRRDYYFWSSTKYESKIILSNFGGLKILF